MVNFRIISKIIGSLLFIEAFFMSWCAIMAIVFHEDDQMAFIMSMLITEHPEPSRCLSACDIGMGYLLAVRNVPLPDSWQHHESDRRLL